MRENQLGVCKISWELERISTKEEIGIGWKSAVEKFGIGRFGNRNQ